MPPFCDHFNVRRSLNCFMESAGISAASNMSFSQIWSGVEWMQGYQSNLFGFWRAMHSGMRCQTWAESRASYLQRERPKVLWRGMKDLPTKCQQNVGSAAPLMQLDINKLQSKSVCSGKWKIWNAYHLSHLPHSAQTCTAKENVKICSHDFKIRIRQSMILQWECCVPSVAEMFTMEQLGLLASSSTRRWVLVHQKREQWYVLKLGMVHSPPGVQLEISSKSGGKNISFLDKNIPHLEGGMGPRWLRI